jgi:phosphoribosylanthranilate isomerase
MPVDAKICGLNTEETLAAAVTSGASHIGLMFFPSSPRAISPERAAELRALVPESVQVVAVMVDPDDDLIDEIVTKVRPDLLQLHGAETPARIAEVRNRTGLPVMKAIKLATSQDLKAAAAYDGVADFILFDAKAPKTLANALPGGNGLSFDWRMLADYKGVTPWMLSGGLDAGNLAEAVGISKALSVDTSSGVEDRPGVKNSDKIKAFLEAASAF